MEPRVLPVRKSMFDQSTTSTPQGHVRRRHHQVNKKRGNIVVSASSSRRRSQRKRTETLSHLEEGSILTGQSRT